MRLRLYVRVQYVLIGWAVWAMPWLWLVNLVSETLALLLMPPLLGYGTWRGISVRVRETPDGLRVRNVARRYRLAWEDIESVEWDHTIRRVRAPVLRRREGRPREVAVLAMGNILFSSRKDEETVRRWQERIASPAP